MSAPTVVGDLVYVSQGTPFPSEDHGHVLAFPAACRNDGWVCSPTWVGDVGGKATLGAPLVDDGNVFVVARIGSPADLRLLAFSPSSCASSTPCAPTWFGDVSAGARPVLQAVWTPPVLGGGMVFVGTLDAGYAAFPQACSADTDGRCAASGSMPPVTYLTVDDGRIFFAGDTVGELGTGTTTSSGGLVALPVAIALLAILAAGIGLGIIRHKARRPPTDDVGLPRTLPPPPPPTLS